MSEMNKPTVSVVMITYGHEAFIRQAVEGVLMQECDFPVELIVADDCSPDNTPAVMQEILATHPRASWIRYTRHTQNKGMMPNFIWALQQARGQYIALCEGDDYWTDPLKLQKQVDVLEGNTYLGGVTHNCLIKRMSNLQLPDRKFDSFEATPSYIIRNDLFFQTASLVFRKEVLTRFPFLKTGPRSGDVFLSLLIAFYGPVYHLNDSMSCYRYHEGGVSQVNEKGYIRWMFSDIRLYRWLDRKSQGRFHQDFSDRIKEMEQRILKRTIKPERFGGGKVKQSKIIIKQTKDLGFQNILDILKILWKQ